MIQYSFFVLNTNKQIYKYLADIIGILESSYLSRNLEDSLSSNENSCSSQSKDFNQTSKTEILKKTFIVEFYQTVGVHLKITYERI